MRTTEPLAERGWPAAEEVEEWLEVLDAEVAAEARRRDADWQLALWVRLLALAAARDLQLDEGERLSGVASATIS